MSGSYPFDARTYTCGRRGLLELHSEMLGRRVFGFGRISSEPPGGAQVQTSCIPARSNGYFCVDYRFS